MENSEAKNFTTPDKFEICEGVTAEGKVRVGGVIYIEDKYNKTFGEFYKDDLPSGKIKPVIDLLVAMSMFTSNLSTDEIYRRISGIDPSAMKGFTDKIMGKLTDVDLKNSETLPTGEVPEQIR